MSNDPRSLESLLTENAELRARIAELEREKRDAAASAERAQRMIEMLPQLIYLFDLVERRNVYANRQIAAFIGYSPSDIQTMGDAMFSTIAHPDNLAELPAYLERVQAAADGEVLDLEFRMRTKGGDYRTLLGREVIFSREPSGKPRLTLGTVQDITEQRTIEAELARFKAVVDNALDGIALLDGTGKVLYENAALASMVGQAERVLGADIGEWMEGAQREVFAKEHLPELVWEGRWVGRLVMRRAGGGCFTAHASFFMFAARVAEGEPAIAAILRDITAELEAEAQRASLQAQVIEAQASALKELGAPLIPIADGVLAMPLVGAIDERRAQQIIEVLLGGIAAQRAGAAILDITGVKNAGAGVAEALVRAAKAARLLGAEVVLTGVGPEVARTMVELGVDLRGITMQGAFQSGIAYALARARRAF